jgi:hypothetical protein
MPMSIWILALVFCALLAYLLRRGNGAGGESPDRLALLVGARRVWGETDESLRKRSVALSRWPFKLETPDLRWWGRAWQRTHRRRS